MFRTPPVIRRLLLLLILGSAVGDCLAQTAPTVAGDGAGIWKAAVPPRPMQGEFDSLDPIGVAAGARIKADCSLNWIDPDDGKRYCFSSGTSLEFFLDKPHASIERARQGWKRLTTSQ
ncbi:MAG: hypothetical protein ABJD53_11970 [Gammaproteobacteria bacterium]